MHVLKRVVSRSIPALRPGRMGWGTFQLSGASIASRLLGFVYSAAVMRLAGPEAVGLFRLAWPLFATAFTVASAGIPYAMAKLIAERLEEPHASPSEAGPATLARQGLLLLLFNSTLTAMVLWVAAPWLVQGIGGEPRALALIQILAPALLLATLSSGTRALFESVRTMAVPALSLVAEQVALSAAAVGTTLWLLRLHAGPAEVAAGLALASVAGEAVGLLVLAVSTRGLWQRWSAVRLQPYPYRPARQATRRAFGWPLRRLRRPPRRPSWWPREILALSLPVAGGRVISSIGASLNVLILPNRLQAGGLSASQAAVEVGLLRGVAVPLMLVPNLLCVALMTNLVPSISRALARHRRHTARLYADKATAATVLLSLPATAAFIALAPYLTRLLYGEREASALLVLVALGAPFAYLGQTLVGVLRGLGRPEIPVQAHLLGLVVEAGLTWMLAGRPELGVRGAAIASSLGFAAAWLVNQLRSVQLLGTELHTAHFVLPMIGAASGGLAASIIAGAIEVALQGAGMPLWATDMVALGMGSMALGAAYALSVKASGVWEWLTAA